jgi:phytoene dehydrogenase-like protein
MAKSIIIVGAGISGLSAGYYSQLNGYNTTIYEKHSIPGGLCAAWKRKGYTFDISMHMLTSSVSGPMHTMWKELGVIENIKFHFHDHMSQIEGLGKNLLLCTDRKKLEDQMLAISPEDAKLTREFTNLIFGPDIMNAALLKPSELTTISDKLKQLLAVLPMIRIFIKYNKVTLQDFAARFKHPFLREAVKLFIDAPGWPMPQFPMAAMAGFMRNGVTEAGTPLGGSHQVILKIAERFTQVGGNIQFNKPVSQLLIEDNHVVGIKLKDGSEQKADLVIWAGDGHTLIFDMLGGKYLDDKIRNMYKNWMPVKSVVQVMLGVNMDLSAEPHRIICELDEPFTIAGREHKWICAIHKCFDPSLAPAGKSVVEIWFDTEYNYWEELAKDKENYLAEKQRIADFSIAVLEKRWPGFTSKVEVIDVPTPVTYTKYTGNWQGSPDGWYITPDNMQKMDAMRSLPGLEKLYMVGQWTVPFSGTVIAALSGRQVIQLMCHKDGKKFVTQPGQ